MGDVWQSGLAGTFTFAKLQKGLTEADFGEGVAWTAVPDPQSTEIDQGTTPVVVVPEPATMTLLGLGGLLVALRRRSRKA